MAFCSKCGTKISRQADFCSSCGADLAKHVPEDTFEQNLIPKLPIQIPTSSLSSLKNLRINRKALVTGVVALVTIIGAWSLSGPISNWQNKRDYNGKLTDLASSAPSERGVFVNTGITCSTADRDHEWVEIPMFISSRVDEDHIYFDNWQALDMPAVGEGGGIVINETYSDISDFYWSSNIQNLDSLGRLFSGTMVVFTSSKLKTDYTKIGENRFLLEIPNQSYGSSISLIMKEPNKPPWATFLRKEVSVETLDWYEKDCD